jgi:hypothetical protein
VHYSLSEGEFLLKKEICLRACWKRILQEGHRRNQARIDLLPRHFAEVVTFRYGSRCIG